MIIAVWLGEDGVEAVLLHIIVRVGFFVVKLLIIPFLLPFVEFGRVRSCQEEAAIAVQDGGECSGPTLADCRVPCRFVEERKKNSVLPDID